MWKRRKKKKRQLHERVAFTFLLLPRLLSYMQIALQRPRRWDAVYVKWKMSANYDMKYEHIPKCNKTHHATPPRLPRTAHAHALHAHTLILNCTVY